jgi:hypothetical protein
VRHQRKRQVGRRVDADGVGHDIGSDGGYAIRPPAPFGGFRLTFDVSACAFRSEYRIGRKITRFIAEPDD